MGNRGKSKNWEIKKKKQEVGNKNKRGHELARLRMKKKEVEEKNKLGSIRNGMLRVKKKQKENKVKIRCLN